MTPPTPPAAPKKNGWLTCLMIPFVLFGCLVCAFAGIFFLYGFSQMTPEQMSNAGYGIALAAVSIFVLAIAYLLIRGIYYAKTSKQRIAYLLVLGILILFSCIGGALVTFFQNFELVW